MALLFDHLVGTDEQRFCARWRCSAPDWHRALQFFWFDLRIDSGRASMTPSRSRIWKTTST
jgi:hypothetical protein